MEPGGARFGAHNDAAAMPVVSDTQSGGADEGILALLIDVQRSERSGFGKAVEIEVGVLNRRPGADQQAAEVPVAAVSQKSAELAAVSVAAQGQTLQTDPAGVVGVPCAVHAGVYVNVAAPKIEAENGRVSADAPAVDRNFAV